MKKILLFSQNTPIESLKNPLTEFDLHTFIEKPELFPKKWHDKSIYATGTQAKGGTSIYIPYIEKVQGKVVMRWHWIGDMLSPNNKSVYLACFESDYVRTFESMNNTCSRCQGKMEKAKRRRNPVCQKCQRNYRLEYNKRKLAQKRGLLYK